MLFAVWMPTNLDPKTVEADKPASGDAEVTKMDRHTADRKRTAPSFLSISMRASHNACRQSWNAVPINAQEKMHLNATASMLAREMVALIRLRLTQCIASIEVGSTFMDPLLAA